MTNPPATTAGPYLVSAEQLWHDDKPVVDILLAGLRGAQQLQPACGMLVARRCAVVRGIQRARHRFNLSGDRSACRSYLRLN